MLHVPIVLHLQSIMKVKRLTLYLLMHQQVLKLDSVQDNTRRLTYSILY